MRRQPHDEQDNENKRPMAENRGAHCTAEPLFLLLEHEMDVARAVFHPDVEMSLRRSGVRLALRRRGRHYGGMCLAHFHRARCEVATAKRVPQQRGGRGPVPLIGCTNAAFGLVKPRTIYVSLHLPIATGEPPWRVSASRAVSTGPLSACAPTRNAPSLMRSSHSSACEVAKPARCSVREISPATCPATSPNAADSGPSATIGPTPGMTTATVAATCAASSPRRDAGRESSISEPGDAPAASAITPSSSWLRATIETRSRGMPSARSA